MSVSQWLTPSVVLAAVGAVVWLVRLEALAKRAKETADAALREIEKLESEVDGLRPIATHLEVLAAKMSALIERVAEGNAAARERFNALDSKIDHALANARLARAAAERHGGGR